MSRWSDAFHALSTQLTHETHVDTCTDAESRTDLIDVAHVSSSVPCVTNRTGGALHGPETQRDGDHVSSSVPCVRPAEGIGGARDARPGRRLTYQQPRAAGRQATALQQPPSWAGASRPPPAGAWCSCCRGQRWWSEARDPAGWRCGQCHPPAHLPPDAVRKIQT